MLFRSKNKEILFFDCKLGSSSSGRVGQALGHDIIFRGSLDIIFFLILEYCLAFWLLSSRTFPGIVKVVDQLRGNRSA